MRVRNVLSLFDGISCGQLALHRAGISYDTYYASEIDKHAISVTQHNFKNTVQLGDVTSIDFKKLKNIDLVMGGSPCQGFSILGKQKSFKDPRSKLFFEFIRALDELKPKYFLLENVKMKEEFQDTISRYLKCQPILIDSSKVSAQMRKRLYWTNIKGVDQPEDLGILLKDIIDDGYVEKSKSWCMLESWNRFPKKTESAEKRYKRSMMPIVFSKESCTFSGGWRPLNRNECERLQNVPDNYTSVVPEKVAMGLLGNGWTVDVISHILKSIKKV